jgi:hypothetical protein
MHEIAKDFLIGMSLSSVPVYVLTKNYFENKLTIKDFDLKENIIYLSLQMGLINVLLFALVRNIFPDLASNPLVYGLLMSIALSMLTETFHEVPIKVLKMKNHNLYHLYLAAILTVLYFVLIKLK